MQFALNIISVLKSKKELFAAETRFINTSILTLSYRTTNAEFQSCYTRASNSAHGFKTTCFITLHIHRVFAISANT